MRIGIFIPVGNNGWLISNGSPQYKPSFELEKDIVQRAEALGFDFGLAMVKFHGYGGSSEFWDYALESFTTIAGLAAVTEKLELFASSAVLTLPPAMTARMAVSIDSISGGRFGINIVTGWQAAEYESQGLWPGNDYFGYRYDYAAEYVDVMKDLWANGRSNYQGKHFTMDGAQLKPFPSRDIPIVTAGQSPRGMEFAATHCDYNFLMASGLNTPTAHQAALQQLADANERNGGHCVSLPLFMVISAPTDEEAMAKWNKYHDEADLEAISWLTGQAYADVDGDDTGTAKTMALPEGAVNMNMGTIVGSYETVARLLDAAAGLEGTGGIMIAFDDFTTGLDDFGKYIQPLMKSRADVAGAVA